LVIDPAVAGAVAVIVKAAVPPVAIPLAVVTVHVSSAPAADGNEPQLAPVAPAPAATAVATTPAGS